MPCRRFFVLIGLFFPPTTAGNVVKALVDHRFVAGRAVNRINSAIRGRSFGNPISMPQGACIGLDLAGPKERVQFLWLLLRLAELNPAR
jgi:hypothetical protein